MCFGLLVAAGLQGASPIVAVETSDRFIADVELTGLHRLYRQHDPNGSARARVVLIAYSFVLISLVLVFSIKVICPCTRHAGI
jgi:hypothetical protein